MGLPKGQPLAGAYPMGCPMEQHRHWPYSTILHRGLWPMYSIALNSSLMAYQQHTAPGPQGPISCLAATGYLRCLAAGAAVALLHQHLLLRSYTSWMDHMDQGPRAHLLVEKWMLQVRNLQLHGTELQAAEALTGPFLCGLLDT